MLFITVLPNVYFKRAATMLKGEFIYLVQNYILYFIHYCEHNLFEQGCNNLSESFF